MKRTNGQTDEIDGREKERIDGLTKLMDWRRNETDGMTKLWTGEGANRRTDEIDELEDVRNQRNDEIDGLENERNQRNDEIDGLENERNQRKDEITDGRRSESTDCRN